MKKNGLIFHTHNVLLYRIPPIVLHPYTLYVPHNHISNWQAVVHPFWKNQASMFDSRRCIGAAQNVSLKLLSACVFHCMRCRCIDVMCRVSHLFSHRMNVWWYDFCMIKMICRVCKVQSRHNFSFSPQDHNRQSVC